MRRERGKGKRTIDNQSRFFYIINKAIYIEPLASRPPHVFQESSESFGEEGYVKRDFLKH